MFTARYGLDIELCFKLECSSVFPYSFVCLFVRACVCVSLEAVNSLNNNTKERLMLLIAAYETSVGKVSPREQITWLDVDGGTILKCDEAWRESLESLTVDQDEYPWWAVVNTVVNIRIASKGWHCEQRRGCYSANPVNAELNPISHLLALLGAHRILHISRIRVQVMRSYATHWQ